MLKVPRTVMYEGGPLVGTGMTKFCAEISTGMTISVQVGPMFLSSEVIGDDKTTEAVPNIQMTDQAENIIFNKLQISHLRGNWLQCLL